MFSTPASTHYPIYRSKTASTAAGSPTSGKSAALGLSASRPINVRQQIVRMPNHAIVPFDRPHAFAVRVSATTKAAVPMQRSVTTIG